MNYAIRLTYTYQQMVGVIQRISDDADVVVVYEHDESNRKHIHLYTEGTKSTVQTIKNWITKELSFKPDKSDWSFKTAQDRKFITYMSKGKLDPCAKKGISDSEIDELRKKWVQRQPKEEQEKNDKKDITQWTISKLLAEWTAKNTKYVGGYYDPPEDYDLVKYAIKLHVDHEKTFTDFSLIRCIHTSWGISDNRVQQDKLIKNVCKRIYPQ